MNALEHVFGLVWRTSLSAAVLIGLGVLVLACFGKVLPAWARYGIWLLVFLRLMVPVAPPSNLSIWNLDKDSAGRVVLSAPEKVAPLVSAPPAGYKPAVQQTGSLHYRRGLPVAPMVWLFGMAGWIGVALFKHQRFARWVKRQPRCDDQRVLALVERARQAFRVRSDIRVIWSECCEAPAIFGIWRARLLLPANWVKTASDEELHGVLLHEIAHVKCRDTLMNWVCILLRSVYWFNPLVWYAFRRLRRERESFCDALVLARLRPDARTIYGNTLIRIAAQLSGASSPTTLVPILRHKPEIHRRIHMIAKYKTTPWLISAAFLVVLVALAGLTFTRAADKSPTQGPPAARKGSALEEELAKQRELVLRLQARVDELRGADPLERGSSSRYTETLRALDGRRIEVQSELRRVASLYKYLSKQSRSELRRSISTASPDAQLSELLQQEALTKQKLADLIEDRAPEHPDVKRTMRVLARINQQIEERIEGIMAGLKVRVEIEEEQVRTLEQAIDHAQKEYRAGLQGNRSYHEALRELQAQEEILHRLRLRIAEERIERALEGAKRK